MFKMEENNFENERKLNLVRIKFGEWKKSLDPRVYFGEMLFW